MSGVASLPPYRACAKPDCARLVSYQAQYCCTPCYYADEGGYEIAAHSPGCDARYAERVKA